MVKWYSEFVTESFTQKICSKTLIHLETKQRYCVQTVFVGKTRIDKVAITQQLLVC